MGYMVVRSRTGTTHLLDASRRASLCGMAARDAKGQLVLLMVGYVGTRNALERRVDCTKCLRIAAGETEER